MRVNLASGQRPFDSPWVNVDIREQGYALDILADVTNLPGEINNCEAMAALHVVEHIEMSKVPDLFKHWNDRLRDGGKLLVQVPDMDALIEARQQGRIDDYIFNVNVYGAYQTSITDLHRWSYTKRTLPERATEKASWSDIKILNGLHELDLVFAGTDIPYDWWFMSIVFTK